MKHHRQALDRGNTLVSRFISKLPTTGNWFNEAQNCSSNNSVVENVILHRLRKKFEKPNHSRDKELDLEALSRFVDDDERLALLDKMSMRSVAYKIRPIIHQWLKDIKFSESDGWFGPGESFNSSGGWTSATDKVNTFPYTVTSDCAEDFFNLVWKNRQWRRVLCYKVRKDGLRKQFTAAIMADRALDFLIDNRYFEIVPGSRFASVPKDNDERRGINIEPLGNLVCQRVDGLALRRCLDHIGNSIGHGDFDPGAGQSSFKRGDGQQRQGDILRTRGCGIATIDLKSASNSISLEFCKLVLPSKLLKRLMRHRCDVVCHSDGNGQWLNMMSSMGNGFTFELLTIIVLAIGRFHDTKASAYGDDLIVSTGAFSAVSEDLEKAGFQLNRKKTFAQGFLRESCGVFTWFGLEFEAYDFHWMETMVDLTVTCNKLYRLWNSPYMLEWRVPLRRLWTQLVQLVDTQYRAPIWGGLDTFVFDPAVPLKTTCNSRFLATHLQHVKHCVVESFSLEQIAESRLRIKRFDAELASYFHSLIPVQRGRRGNLRLVSNRLYVTPGSWTRLNPLYSLYKAS